MGAERRFGSVRARTTLGATLVVAVALAVGAAAFFLVLRGSVLAGAERTAEARAEQLAQAVEADGADAVSVLDDEVVQLLDDAGDVVATSDEAEGVRLPPGDPSLVTVDEETVLLASEDVESVRGLDGDGHVVVGVPIDDELETLTTVGVMLAVAVPLIVALVAATTWFVTGRALRPVTRIRREVDGITADRLDRRVPVPESSDEIAALATTMNVMLDRLDRSAQAQRAFVSDASHELRSPLATIRQHAELAQTYPQTTSVSELAEVVHEEGLRLQGIVDALLLLARLSEGAEDTSEAVDVDDLALAEASRLRARGLEIDSAGIGAARVCGSGRLLGQVLRNLCDNAARHAAGRVSIATREADGEVVITVEDDGAGIPEAERERVFERFVRLDEARARDAGGSGLGLAIVQGIASAGGGTVEVGDSRWGGARFTVTLPALP
ncbi:sensor histidine kinase [Microbacterium marinilacus]|uniref:histidine kinase n=1 Tax=Microbacterium marinilacus TaxID=415209 RepID=A0ABP7B890_9MICO|nr:HAMP domain-containing sensor histidine kinase [Microbacterium marinilacus]MBY0687455.1 HAMP domain-containing histidine kinase [Microbacterium marinilacus]